MEKGPNKKFIFVCTDSDCKKNGSKTIVKMLSKEVKSAGVKSSVDIIKCKCMGHCKKGPNIIMDNKLYQKVDVNDLEALISECILTKV